MRLIAILMMLLMSLAVSAQEFMPYKGSRITAEQWQSYHDEVATKHAATRKTPAPDMVSYDDSATYTVYYFTTPENPAHPGWVTVRMEDRLSTIGYFAGDVDAFTKMFLSIRGLWNEKVEATKKATGK
ncbi:MAG: hypothetical protein ACREPE_08280 [Lysobacter sp.]